MMKKFWQTKKNFVIFCVLLQMILKKTTDVVRASMKIATFVSTLETSVWWSLAQFIKPLLKR